MSGAATPWQRGRLDARRGAPRLLFGRMYEDWSIEADDSNDPTQFNDEAMALGPTFNVFGSSPTTLVPVSPAFLPYHPSLFLRPFDARAIEHD